MQAATLSTHVYVACPACSRGTSRVDHLFGTLNAWFGTWYCDECGAGYRGQVRENQQVFVELTGNQKVETYDLLRLRDTDLFVVVNGMEFHEPGTSLDPNEALRRKRYYYEEHTCPTNILRTERVIVPDQDLAGDFVVNDDAHGLFDLVAYRSVKSDPEYRWAYELVERLLTTPAPAEA